MSLVDLVPMQAHAPALVRLNHFAAQGLGNDLVSEAHSDQRHFRAGKITNEILQWRHPVEIVVDTVARTGN